VQGTRWAQVMNENLKRGVGGARDMGPIQVMNENLKRGVSALAEQARYVKRRVQKYDGLGFRV